MNQHTVVRAAGVVLALLAGAQAAAAPAWARGPGDGTLAPAAGDDPPLLRPPLRFLLQPLCVPASSGTRSPLPALVNVGVQDVGVLSDTGPRTCAGGPDDQALSRVVDLPVLSGIVPAGP